MIGDNFSGNDELNMLEGQKIIKIIALPTESNNDCREFFIVCKSGYTLHIWSNEDNPFVNVNVK